MKNRAVVIVLIAVLIFSMNFIGSGEEDFSADLLIEELRRAENLINSGDVAKGLDSLRGVRAILNSKIGELSENKAEVESKKLEELQGKLEAFEERLSEIEKRKSGKDSGFNLKVGYVNATEAFNVFKNAVKEERQKAQKKNEELVTIREKAIKGKISESKYKKKRDVLQAEKLKAQLEIDLAMLKSMILAKGFKSVKERLIKLKGQAKPIIEELNNALKNMRQGSAIPEKVSQDLTRINNQYQRLDDLLTKLIETKIFQVANQQAAEKGYDLVLRQENVVLYGNQNTTKDLTEMTKKRLKEEMSS